ncbi:MAG: hypothetical protein ACP5UJ_05490 [Athalassotoga sp.]|uniref:hypothetical protein n=1 Tax=Athalassotoga sp. TaxID=2022597 RepID=UPI003D020CBA
MNRRVAIVVIFSVIVLIGVADLIELLSFSGALSKTVSSISKFQNLYSQNSEMKKQLSEYGTLLNSKNISIQNLRNALLKISPDANFKISGDTMTLQSPVKIDPYEFLNLIDAYTNVAVVKMHFSSNAPIFYEYQGTNYGNSGTKYVLDSFVVTVYGG